MALISGRPSEARVAATGQRDVGSVSQRRLMIRRFMQSKLAVGGGIILIIMYLVAIFAPFLSPTEPNKLDSAFQNASPSKLTWDGGLAVCGTTQRLDEATFTWEYTTDCSKAVPVEWFSSGWSYKLFGLIPTDVHLMTVDEPGRLLLWGADTEGRDVFSRTLEGSQVSMSIGLLGVAISTVLGATIGTMSGYFGGAIDTVSQRIIELIMSIPTLPFWAALAAVLPRNMPVTQRYFFITLILSLVVWTGVARQVRGKVMSYAGADYVLAALAAGSSHARIIFTHMVPNSMSHIVVVATLAIPATIIAETSLSFLGIGMLPPAISWGVLLQDAQKVQVVTTYPWMLIPAVAVIVAVTCFQLLGDGVRDAVDPMGEVGRARRRVLDKTASSTDSRTEADTTDTTGTAAGAVVSVRDLSVQFPTVLGVVHALNGVTFDVPRRRVLGVVGESGCGKSVTARAMLQIIEPPGRIAGGRIRFVADDGEGGGPEHGPTGEPVRANGAGIDLAALHPRSEEIRHIRGGQISMIFQEPMTSLNPVYTIGAQISEAVLLHQTADHDEAAKRAVDMLRRVGMPNPERVATSYPHQLSGGMRQRAMIAMALSCMPRLLIADEPTTALDVTTEAQILQLMRDLQDEYGMSIMFITHSMGVVAQMCDEVVVMYLGRVVERAGVEDLFYDPKHPYTISLLRSIPRIGLGRHGRLEAIKGRVPEPYTSVPGCPFHPRCPSAMTGLCDTVMPLETVSPAGSDHTVRCHLYPGSTPEDVATHQPAPTAQEAT